MKTIELDFKFNKEKIALFPSCNREESKLLILNRKEKIIEHDKFYNIGNYLKSGDVLIYNDSKVLPNRVYGKRKTGGNVEILFLTNPFIGNINDCLIKSSAILKKNEIIYLKDNNEVKILEKKELGEYKVEINILDKIKFFSEFGQLPLPPYIKREYQKKIDDERYQTKFAKYNGSIASPTAALHFSEALINKLKKSGIIFLPVTLHVGIGTFKPIKSENLKDHKMHAEYFEVKKETAKEINFAKKEGRRIIAIGTTSLRALESAVNKDEEIEEKKGFTNIFIYPGYNIKSINGMITNFHQPKSTLVALVSAFTTKKLLFKAYEEAMKNDYRLFSYGDSMLIV